MSVWDGVLEKGCFTVRVEEKKFNPGDQLREDLISMGMSLGKNLTILYSNHDDVDHFSVVDQRTGDTIIVEVSNVEAEAKKLWDSLDSIEQDMAAEALRGLKKIEAMRIIREATGAGLKPAKNCIDSRYVLDAAHSKPHAVDNGDGTGSLKGKLTGMGF